MNNDVDILVFRVAYHNLIKLLYILDIGDPSNSLALDSLKFVGRMEAKFGQTHFT